MLNNFIRFTLTVLSISSLFISPTFAAITYVSQFWGIQWTGDGQFNSTNGLTIDASGNIYVVDSATSRIQKFSSNGTYVSQFGSNGSGDGQFSNPLDMAIDSSGNIYVLDSNNFRVQKFDSNGTFISKFGTMGVNSGQFKTPLSIAVDPSGNIYVSEGSWVFSNPRRVQKFDSNGTYVSQFGSFGSGNSQFSHPIGLISDSSGNIYVVDDSTHSVKKFDSNGTFISKFGSYGSGDGQLNRPYDISLDTSGNIYTVELYNHRVQKFDSNGTYVSQFGSEGSSNGQFSYPTSITVSSAGNIYVGDSLNYRVQILNDILDSTAPTLSQTTAVTTPTNDNTPSYTFTSDEAGTITYGGSCSSATTSATVGANTISFSTLADGAYSNCTITVTDSASNASSALAVTAFTVDTLQPTISNSASSPLFPPGAAITWTTNEASTSRVEYGANTSYGLFTTLDSSLVTSHTVNITGLAQGTTYHYRVLSVDAAGNSITGDDNIFTTSNGGGGGVGSNYEKKETKEEEKYIKNEQKTEEKEQKEAAKEEKKAEKAEEKKDKKNTKAEILSKEPLYEPFATRERTLSIALKLSGIEVTGLYICQNRFTDTPTPYSCEVAEKAQFAGLISQERTTFRPTRSVTRVEAYAIFMKSICVAPETNENNWEKLIIKKAIELGFTTRTIDTFRPDRTISTPEMFALAHKIGEWKTNNPNSCENK